MEGGDVDPNGNGAGSESHIANRAALQQLENVVIRFAGDSGDGMQLTGDRFTSEAALFGNDLATQPSFPAEIRPRRAPCLECHLSRSRSPTMTS